MNYYRVEAKCGHVRKSHYIIKSFYVKADSGKEAAAKVRMFPRVKHNWKDAINTVCKISQEEYVYGCVEVNNDLYFKVTNSTEQRFCQCVAYDEVYERVMPEKRLRENKTFYYIKMKKIISKDMRRQLSEVV